ncbi:MAG: hypothetical protein DCF30_11060 [Hyphomicrobiales bacterium]|nr:MAG: hypothetical protein DCF30_11060 [Hyphomicrobiales bacterium]
MEPVAQKADAHFDLAISDGGLRLKLAEARLTLSDEGISYTLDGRSGLRTFSNLRSVRMQAVHGGKRSPWEALIELSFGAGMPLLVHSSSPWGGNDPARDPVFIAFVEELHRRIPAVDAARIRFLRGIPEGRHMVMKFAFVVFLIVFGGAGALILFKTADGTIPVLAMLGPMAGLVAFGAWMYHSIEKSRPGVYTPDALPRDLFP